MCYANGSKGGVMSKTINAISTHAHACWRNSVPTSFVGVCLMLLSLPAFAAASNTGTAGAPLFLAFAIAYLTRRMAIGGWLFYFYLQLYVSLPFWLLVFASTELKYLSPAEWNSSELYAFYLLSTIPSNIAMLAETIFATMLLFQRDLAHVQYLRRTLIGYVIIASITVIVDVAYFNSTSTVTFDVLMLSFATIWCFYFYRSDRVRWVFIENKWNHESFTKRFGEPTQEERSISNRKGWIAAAVTFFIITGLGLSSSDKADLLHWATVGLISAVFIGALVRYYSPRPPRPRIRAGNNPQMPRTESIHNGTQVATSRKRSGSMNNRQRLVLLSAAILVVICILFPPFVIHARSGASFNSGFSFLFSPSNEQAVVNTGLLAIELFVIIIVAAIGWFLSKD